MFKRGVLDLFENFNNVSFIYYFQISVHYCLKIYIIINNGLQFYEKKKMFSLFFICFVSFMFFSILESAMTKLFLPRTMN